MVRDLRRLADTRFDVVVIGAGFYGALAAWDATLRGLSVALIDKNDFGAATSFNNLKTLHGGLRSLQSLNFPQMRLFIRERRALARVARHLVRPLPFVVPTYRHPQRAASLLRVALLINDLVARDRHQGLDDPSLDLPAGAIVSREECLRLNPVIDQKGVTGGAVWHDYQMDNTDRMTLSFVLSAADAGAAAANYVTAVQLLRDGSRVNGVRVTDALTGSEFDIRAQTVINATGPWATSFLESNEPRAASPAPRLSRAMNLVTRPLVHGNACGGVARGRFLFLVPWRDVSLLGTSHDVHAELPEQLTVTRWDLEAFLADAREAFPHANLATGDVRLVHRGLLPMVSGTDSHVKLLRESAVVDHTRDGAAGLISMFGVRYTTARHTAERAVDAVFTDRGDRRPPPCRTAVTPVAGGAITNKDSFLRAVLLRDIASVTPDLLRRLALTYGTGYDAVLQLIRDQPVLAEPLGRHCPVTGAEIVHAVRTESAICLSDALLRRTEAGSAGHPGADAVERAARHMGDELAWDDWKQRNQIAELEAFYRLPI
ncbi:MAG TPA: glycerol-3-phosphate dehydrogenase/oxidase [Vicinamibacterales bacterium]|nr:glycerol-3-phosphate dehydrogenase/oxidase [Vicinamibacterales bacterium]